MKYSLALLGLVAVMATGCAETVEVCNRYGSRTVCRTENAAEQRSINQRAMQEYMETLDKR